MKVLGVIPARAGSKGVPFKNSRPFAGKSLIAYSIEAAQGVSGLDVALSTDDPVALEIGRSYGVVSEYVRPAELSGDRVSTMDTVLHLVEWLRARGREYDALCLLQPTSPFRTSKDIQDSLELIGRGGASVVGVSKMSPHPSICMKLESDGSWDYLVKPQVGVNRRQDMDDSYYALNGAIYTIRTDVLLREKKFIFENTALLRMSDENSIDIDTELDFSIAEFVMKRRFAHG